MSPTPKKRKAKARRPRAGCIDVPEHEVWLLVLSFVRYAMGRRSTAPHLAVDFVRQYFFYFNAQERSQLERELAMELDRSERLGKFLGDKIDDDAWRKLQAWMRTQEQKEKKG